MERPKIARLLGIILTILGVTFLILGFHGGSTELMIHGASITLAGLAVATMLPSWLKRQQ